MALSARPKAAAVRSSARMQAVPMAVAAWGVVPGGGDSICGDGLTQGGVFDSGEPRGGGDGVAFIKQALALRGCFDVEHGRAAHGPGLVEGVGSLGVDLFAPAHQGARGGAQGLLDLAGTGVAVCHQGGKCQTVACGVIGRGEKSMQRRGN